jgi:hypothetical protein
MGFCNQIQHWFAMLHVQYSIAIYQCVEGRSKCSILDPDDFLSLFFVVDVKGYNFRSAQRILSEDRKGKRNSAQSLLCES